MAPQQSVLIVEDDAELRRMYTQALVMSGFVVREARGGFEALKKVDSDVPDIVVLDLSLPGIDGFTVHAELASHAHTRSIPIVVVTGVTANLDDLDVACLLRKPVTPDSLVVAVRRCLASAAGSAGC
jgi:DNA-binding response OmpR family regulator